MPTDMHPGVSLEAPRLLRFRLRWRERDASGKIRPRSRVLWAASLVEATGAAAALSRTLRQPREGPGAGGIGEPPTIPAAGDLSSVFDSYLQWRRDVAHRSPSTLAGEERALRRFAEVAAQQSPDSPLGALTLARFPDVCAVAFADLAATTRALRNRQVYAAWVWATDADPRYEGLAPAPRTAGRCVPPGPPPRAVAPPSPTFADLDRCIQLVKAGTRTRLLLEILRYTGLRVAQARALQVQDVDLVRGSLYVRSGKTRREKEGRLVPLCLALRDRLEAAIDGKASSDPIVALTTNIPVHQALRRVFVAGQLPRETWSDIEGRGCKRLCHAFRAAFQSELRRFGVPDRIIDHLVGHVGASVRDRHYAGPDWQDLVQAVRHVPKVGGEPRPPGQAM